MLRKNLLTVALFLTSLCLVNGQSLDTYLQKGLKNSPLLKEYNLQTLSGTLDSLLVKAAYKPQIHQVSQAMYAPASKNFGYDEAITNGGNYSALVNLVQPLFTKKLKESQFRDISLANQTTAINARITENDLKQGITSQYLTVYASFLQIQFSQNTINLLKDQQAGVKSLVNKGIYLQTDLINISLAVTTQEVAVKQANIQFKNNLAILNFICGISDTSNIVLEKPDITIRNSFDISSSPVMIKFTIDSLKNVNSKLAIDMNYKPKLSAFADAGFMAVTPENIPHNFGTSFGINFTIPIYDGQQRKLQYDKASLAENSRSNYKAFYTTQYKQQINQLTEQLKLTDDLISGIRSQLAEQEKLIELYKIEIEKGLVRFLDFLNVVNNYTATKNSLTVSEMNRLQIINQMNYLK